MGTIGAVDHAWKTTVSALDTSYQSNKEAYPSRKTSTDMQFREQRLNTMEIEKQFLDFLINNDHVDIPESDDDAFYTPPEEPAKSDWKPKITPVTFPKIDDDIVTYDIDCNWVFHTLWPSLEINLSKGTLRNESREEVRLTNTISNNSSNSLAPAEHNEKSTLKTAVQISKSQGKIAPSPIGMVSANDFKKYQLRKSVSDASSREESNSQSNQYKKNEVTISVCPEVARNHSNSSTSRDIASIEKLPSISENTGMQHYKRTTAQGKKSGGTVSIKRINTCKGPVFQKIKRAYFATDSSDSDCDTSV